MAMIRASFANFEVAEIKKTNTLTQSVQTGATVIRIIVTLFLSMLAISELTQNATGHMF
jgi:hypothetical protein